MRIIALLGLVITWILALLTAISTKQSDTSDSTVSRAHNPPVYFHTGRVRFGKCVANKHLQEFYSNLQENAVNWQCRRKYLFWNCRIFSDRFLHAILTPTGINRNLYIIHLKRLKETALPASSNFSRLQWSLGSSKHSFFCLLTLFTSYFHITYWITRIKIIVSLELAVVNKDCRRLR